MTERLVVRLDCVFYVLILIRLELKLKAVQLILDVLLQLSVAIENGLVSIDELDL